MRNWFCVDDDRRTDHDVLAAARKLGLGKGCQKDRVAGYDATGAGWGIRPASTHFSRDREGGVTMRSEISEQHDVDGQGRPAGGCTKGRGFSINWQKGPLMVDGVRREPNGAFVEDVIAAALGRIQHYQASEFKCRENALAITKLEEALHWLDHRTRDRQARGVEGTHAV